VVVHADLNRTQRDRTVLSEPNCQTQEDSSGQKGTQSENAQGPQKSVALPAELPGRRQQKSPVIALVTSVKFFSHLAANVFPS